MPRVQVHSHHHVGACLLAPGANSLTPTRLGSVLRQASSSRRGRRPQRPRCPPSRSWRQSCRRDSGRWHANFLHQVQARPGGSPPRQQNGCRLVHAAVNGPAQMLHKGAVDALVHPLMGKSLSRVMRANFLSIGKLPSFPKQSCPYKSDLFNHRRNARKSQWIFDISCCPRRCVDIRFPPCYNTGKPPGKEKEAMAYPEKEVVKQWLDALEGLPVQLKRCLDACVSIAAAAGGLASRPGVLPAGSGALLCRGTSAAPTGRPHPRNPHPLERAGEGWLAQAVKETAQRRREEKASP